MAFVVDVKKTETHHCGLLLDVQEDRVKAAIVYSRTADTPPELLWVYEERIPAGEAGQEMGEKRLFIAIMNAFAEFGSHGLSALRQHDVAALPTLVQVSLSLTGVYTIAKNVVLRSDPPVRVTHSLVRELEKRALKEVREQASGEILARSLDLQVLSNSTAAISLNGYPTIYPFKSSAAEITLCQVVGLGPARLIEHILKCKDKILPEAVVDMDSLMSLYYRAMAELLPKTADACLVAATGNSAELLLIRDSLPQSSTMVSWERPGPASSKNGAAERSLEENLRDLFKNTGDGLSLPKQIYLYLESGQDPIFANQLQAAAKDVAQTSHTVSLVNKAFEEALHGPMSDLTCEAYAYHKKLYADRHLEQL